jgi:hypothetical protein
MEVSEATTRDNALSDVGRLFGPLLETTADLKHHSLLELSQPHVYSDGDRVLLEFMFHSGSHFKAIS